MAYFGGIFFANMGGGGGQNYSHLQLSGQAPGGQPPKFNKQRGKLSDLQLEFFCLQLSFWAFSKTPTGPPDPRSPKTPQQKKKFQKTENPDYPPK